MSVVRIHITNIFSANDDTNEIQFPPSVPDLDGRIVGGIETDISDYPYQLSLEVMGQHSCGASLIAPEWAVTAGHCTDGVPSFFLTIRAGSSTSNSGGKVVRVRRKYVHSKYNSRTIDYDVSVLQLSEPITSEYGVPIQLPNESKYYTYLSFQFGLQMKVL